jgi:hypothetical protein
MNSKKILLATLLAMVFAPVFAEEATDDPAQQTRTRVITRDFTELRALDGMHLMGPGLRMHGKAVKGMPYSAEVVSERQQNLADGNQIVHKTTSMSYRDGAGRTRQEVRNDKDEVLTVTIHDAVDGATYVLIPRTKTATKVARNRELDKAATDAARAKLEQLRKEGKTVVERREIIVRHGDGPEGEMRMQFDGPANMRIEAPNVTAGPGREALIQLGPLAGAFGDMKWAGKATTKDLGTRDIEGVKAQGKLRSYEIPTGEVGNRNPIVVSDESWYSPELQVTVLSKHSDPRSGDSIYRLSAIKREEPAAALFTVPSDYTVKDVMANVARVIEKKAP